MRGLTIIASALVLAACSGGRGGREEAPDVVIDESWPDLPDSAVFGEPMAVDVDSHGHIFILHRAGHDDTDGEGAETISEPTVFMLAANGKLLGKWGAGTFVEPHGLSVDGDDKVWITDTARQQVFRFSHEGTEELVLGERGVAGEDQSHFGGPADIAFSQGRVLVADGFSNNRIVVMDGDGNFLEQWAGLTRPRGIAADGERVYVADSGSSAVQVFSPAGEREDEIGADRSGRPYAVKPIGSSYVLVMEGRDGQDRPGAIGRIYRPDGELERVFDAGVDHRTANSIGQDVAVGRDGSVYLVDSGTGRVVKFELAVAGVEDED